MQLLRFDGKDTASNAKMVKPKKVKSMDKCELETSILIMARLNAASYAKYRKFPADH